MSAAYAVWLLPGQGVGLVAGLPEAVIALALAAMLLLVIGARAWRTGAIAMAAVAIIAVPAVASASVVSNAFGPFDTPFESAADSGFARALGQVGARTEALLPPLERAKAIQPDLLATQTSAVAAPFIYDSGQEVVPIGGFTGTIPEPSLSSLQAMITRGDFHLVIQAPTVTDRRLVWVADHCFPLKPAAARLRGSALRRLLLRAPGSLSQAAPPPQPSPNRSVRRVRSPRARSIRAPTMPARTSMKRSSSSTSSVRGAWLTQHRVP